MAPTRNIRLDTIYDSCVCVCGGGGWGWMAGLKDQRGQKWGVGVAKVQRGKN